MTLATDEIRRMWDIFPIGPVNPISLRAISPKQAAPTRPPVNATFNATDFPDVDDRREAFEAEALRLSGLGYNVYIVMNPISAGFSGEAVCDSDIARRNLILIDLDRAETASCPATDAELQAACDLAEVIAARLQGWGWRKLYRVMSGNGVHLYVPVDLPNDTASRDRVQGLLRVLGEAFDTNAVRVDRSVYNASRITKVPGTIARKGVESGGRPYRMARVL
jgi:hypothetical protein